MSDFTLLDSCCTCFQGWAPCSYCVDTFNCDSCEDRAYSHEIEEETELGFLCLECYHLYEESLQPRLLDWISKDIFISLGIYAGVQTIHDIVKHFLH